MERAWDASVGAWKWCRGELVPLKESERWSIVRASAPAQVHEVVLGSMETIREGEVGLEHGVVGDAQRDVSEGVTDRLGDDQQLCQPKIVPLLVNSGETGASMIV